MTEPTLIEKLEDLASGMELVTRLLKKKGQKPDEADEETC